MRKALTWAGGILAALLVSWAVLHFVISPVNPEQEPPEDHFDSSCWACHLVTDAAEVKSADELAK